MNRADATTLLKAVITEDAEIPAEVVERLGFDIALTVVMSALVDALDLKYAEGFDDERLLIVFAAELRRQYPQSKPLKDTDTVIAVLNGGLGDYECFDVIEADDLFDVATLVIRNIITERFLGPIDIANFCRDAIDSAAEADDDDDDEETP